jgi:hypothetical protein
MKRRIIDTHQHIFTMNSADALAKECRRLNIVKMVLLGLPPCRVPRDNNAILEAARKYPNLFLPFAGIDLDAAKTVDVSQLRDEGFVGLKCIAPSRQYNDQAYFPIYERAADLRMPIVFHLGVIANNKEWADVDSNLMKPVHLDHIARNFSELKIFGAHLGNPWYEEAAMSCRWNPNLFFDLSGSTLKYRSPEYLGGLLWWTPDTQYRSPDRTYAWQKITFGSDVSVDKVEDVIHDYENLMSTLKLSPEFQDWVWYGNAARALGLEEGSTKP